MLSLLALAMPARASSAGDGPATAPAGGGTTRPTAASQRDAGAPKPPFPLAEAATQSESASITLRGIETILKSDGETSSINADLLTLTTEIDKRLEETANFLTSSPSLQALSGQEQEWAAIYHELAGWKYSIERRHAQLQKASTEVEQLASDWQQEQVAVDYWLNHARSTDLLKNAQKSIGRTQASISQTSENLRNHLVDLFATRQAVDGQVARVLEVLDSVHHARDEAFSRLLTRDSPPLWEILRPTKEHRGQADQGEQPFDRQLRAFEAYINRRRNHVYAHIALLLALIAALYWVHYRTSHWAVKQPELEPATRVFGSPIGTAIVLALLVSGWIYPQAPRLMWAAIGAAALIPTVLILRPLIERRWFTWLYALVVFYFLDQLRSVTAIMPHIARGILLFEMLGGFILLLPSPTNTARNVNSASPLARLVRLLRWPWLAAFLLAFAGDLAGYVSLANLLGDAALGSLYLAVILYACTRILSGLLIIALHSRPLCLLTTVRLHRQLIMQKLNLFLHWMALAAWALAMLASLSLATVAIDWVKRVLSARATYGQISLSLGNVLAFLFAIWASVQASRFVRFVLEEDVYERFALPAGIPYAISKMLNYVILLIGFFIAVSSLGYDMTKFTILAGAFGVGLGFGMQNIVNNFVSGLILLFERPVKVGDVVQMDDTTGVVGHIGIRATIIRTNNSAEIIVPNGNLISSKVTNWTLSNRQRGVEIAVAAAASAEPRRVIGILQAVAAAHPLIVKSPTPEAFLTTFSADSFNYQLRAWTNNADRWIEIRSDLSVAIHEAFTKENIPIR